MTSSSIRTGVAGFSEPMPAMRRIALATILVAAVGWLLQVVVARILGPAEYGRFSVLWSFVLGSFGVLLGLQQEIIRAVSSEPLRPVTTPRRNVPLIVVSLVVGGALVAVMIATSRLWAERLFGPGWFPVIVACGAGTIGYLGTLTLSGVLNGLRRWNEYPWVICTDALLRFVLVVVACTAGGHLISWAWAISAGGLAWLILLPRQATRQALRLPGALSVGRHVLHAGQLTIGAACSAILIVGFPVLLRLTSHAPLDASTGTLLALVTLTRAPFVLPLLAFQGVAIAYFVTEPGLLSPRVWRLLSLILAAGVIAAAVASVAGPAVLHLVMGGQFDASGGLIAALTVASAVLGMLTVTGLALVAISHHAWSTLGWLVATVTTTGLLLLPLDVGPRSAVALTIGPTIGLICHLAVISVATSRVLDRAAQ